MVHKKNYDFLPVIIYSFVGENKTKSGRKIGRLGQKRLYQDTDPFLDTRASNRRCLSFQKSFLNARKIMNFFNAFFLILSFFRRHFVVLVKNHVKRAQGLIG